MPIFICAGTPRSGSTWLFNAMRIILTRKFPDLYSAWVESLDEARARNVGATLIKIHAPNEDLANSDSVLTCHRDLRDVASSYQSMGWVSSDEDVLTAIANCRAFHEFWSPRSKADISYADIIERSSHAVRLVADALEISLSADEISEIADLLEATPNNSDPTSSYDPTFLTHANHRNDGRNGRWRDGLNETLAVAITETHRDWLLRMGYDASLRMHPLDKSRT